MTNPASSFQKCGDPGACEPHVVWPLEKELVFGYVAFFLQLFLSKPELFSPAEWQHKTQHSPLKD